MGRQAKGRTWLALHETDIDTDTDTDTERERVSALASTAVPIVICMAAGSAVGRGNSRWPAGRGYAGGVWTARRRSRCGDTCSPVGAHDRPHRTQCTTRRME